MDLKEILESGCICLDLRGDTKKAVIDEMIDLLVGAGKIQEREAARRAVCERERKMSTGMQWGIAIPHGRMNLEKELAVAFGIKREGVDFGSLDGQLSNIIVMTLSSTTRPATHIQFLAEISKRLSMPSIRQQILTARTPADVVGALVGDRDSTRAAASGTASTLP